MGPIGCPETSTSNYLTLLNNPEDRRFQVLDKSGLKIRHKWYVQHSFSRKVYSSETNQSQKTSNRCCLNIVTGNEEQLFLRLGQDVVWSNVAHFRVILTRESFCSAGFDLTALREVRMC